ncbi:conserved Plasmodium protein, unknown function [Plasmodium relictum]|uniref:Uncharacterized protein n=1 Tax=Plasmodium relictum TaxID=85471 RepID=A0A1J1H6N7_PLARL|nr:conserved Plasmodium protein, unknown function [Plasmodium relictum]CRH00606.1 conserved Plasmodium protein, unknown function [Plasmodium relictum]
MYFVKYFDENFVKIIKRKFTRNIESSLKPSSLRIRSDKKNFNDIINKYLPNKILKKKNISLYKNYNSNSNKKYYLSSKIERKIKLQETTNNKDITLLEENNKNDLFFKENEFNISILEKPNKENECNLNTLEKSNKENECNLSTLEKSNELLEISKEEYDIQKYKNKLHKKIWLTLKRNNEKEFQYYYDILNKYPLKDEVSYSILMHGNLIISNGENINESFKILNEMKLKKVHCSLIRFNERLLHSYYELIKLNARPNNNQWKKVLRTVWFTSALIKARRQKYILRKIKKIKKDNSVSLSNFNNIFNIHNLETLYIENKDPLIGKNFKEIN